MSLKRWVGQCSCLSTVRRRNRYHDIVPFDATRVKLVKPLCVDGEVEVSDYINASFIWDHPSLTQAMASGNIDTEMRELSKSVVNLLLL